MPFNIGFGELLLVLIVALLVFGGRLPEVGRSLGKGLSEFKKGLKGVKDLSEDLEDDEDEATDRDADEEDEVSDREPEKDAG
jgi:sec-independent protein translocase protein TatA